MPAQLIFLNQALGADFLKIKEQVRQEPLIVNLLYAPSRLQQARLGRLRRFGLRRPTPTYRFLPACFQFLSRFQPEALQAALESSKDAIVRKRRGLEETLCLLDQGSEEASPQAM